MESYRFAEIKGSLQSDEFERLKRQAQMFWAKESSVLSRLDLSIARTGVDMGCGHGFVSALIAEAYPDMRLQGLDVSEELITKAQEYHGWANNLEFLVGSAYETKLPDDSQDFVYSRLVYQHLGEPEKAVKEAFRICTPGGHVAMLDIDSQLQFFSEDLPCVTTLLTEITKAQKLRGGNREIGRRLPALLQEVGCKDIQVVLEPISTVDVPLEQFCAITMGFAEWFIADERGEAIYAAAIKELKALQKPVFGMLTVMFVFGSKP